MQRTSDAASSSSAAPVCAPITENDQSQIEPAETDWRLLRRWIVAGNPFYPLSTVLVLFGIFLLSGEERLFSAELTQLWFNFGALEGYGLLIVVTALMLFRRNIHYDTLLLVVLTTLPILVPFILISQAAFLGGGLMALFCCAAAVAGSLQFMALRRGIPELPLGGGMAGYFAMIVTVNLALPILIKQFHANADAIRWAVQLEPYGHLAWNLLLPLLVVAGFGIRRASARSFGEYPTAWLPLTWLALLVAGTATHIASLGYVYSHPWERAYLYPTLWLGSWLAWWRRMEWTPDGAALLRERLIVLPAFVALIAWVDSTAPALYWINLLNLVCFGWLQWRHPHNRIVTGLLIVTLMSMLRCAPPEAIAASRIDITRAELLLLGVSLGTIASGVWRRSPLWGVSVAAGGIFPLHFFWLNSPQDWPLVIQLALLTWWFHSFRWDAETPLATGLRRLGFGLWCLQSLLWFQHSGGAGRIDLVAVAAVVAASAALSAWLRRRPAECVYCVLAIGVCLLDRVPGMIKQLREIPTGLVILLGGLVCFALGTTVALWRQRWERTPEPPHD